MRVAYSRLDTFSSRSPNRLFWPEHVQLNLTGKRINWCNTCCSQNSLNTYTHRNLIKYEKKNINPNIQVKYELKLYLRDFIVHMCLFFHESNFWALYSYIHNTYMRSIKYMFMEMFVLISSLKKISLLFSLLHK